VEGGFLGAQGLEPTGQGGAALGGFSGVIEAVSGGADRVGEGDGVRVAPTGGQRLDLAFDDADAIGDAIPRGLGGLFGGVRGILGVLGYRVVGGPRRFRMLGRTADRARRTVGERARELGGHAREAAGPQIEDPFLGFEVSAPGGIVFGPRCVQSWSATRDVDSGRCRVLPLAQLVAKPGQRGGRIGGLTQLLLDRADRRRQFEPPLRQLPRTLREPTGFPLVRGEIRGELTRGHHISANLTEHTEQRVPLTDGGIEVAPDITDTGARIPATDRPASLMTRAKWTAGRQVR